MTKITKCTVSLGQAYQNNLPPGNIASRKCKKFNFHNLKTLKKREVPSFARIPPIRPQHPTI